MSTSQCHQVSVHVRSEAQNRDETGSGRLGSPLCQERREAARAAGITPRTLYRWLNESEFDAAYRTARRQAYGQSISRLQQGSAAAATTLLKVMVDPTTPPSTRVRAAEAVLSHAAKAIEIEDIDARVRALEESAEANNGGQR